MNSRSDGSGEDKPKFDGTMGGQPIGLRHRVVPSVEYVEVAGEALTAQVWHGPLRLRKTLTEPDRLLGDTTPAATQPGLVLEGWAAREAYLKAKEVGLTVGWRQVEAIQQRSKALLASGVVPGDVVLVDGAASFELVISARSVWTVGAALAVALPGCAPAELKRLRRLVRPHVELWSEGTLAEGDGIAGATAPEVQPRNPALIVVTSGSTGEPKAIDCPLAQVWFSLDVIQERLGYREDDVILLTLPTAFDNRLYQLLLAARAAATAVLRPRITSCRSPTTSSSTRPRLCPGLRLS